MKKITLFLLVVSAGYIAKAQSTPNKLSDSLLQKSLHGQYLQIAPQTQPLFFNLQQPNAQVLAAEINPVKINPVDHMPIAFLQGESKMPVSKLGGTDKMPILKLDSANQNPVTVIIRP